MEMTREEFEVQFKETLDSLVEGMAEHEDVAPTKFFGMVCFLENLAFFSPVIWAMIEEQKKA